MKKNLFTFLVGICFPCFLLAKVTLGGNGSLTVSLETGDEAVVRTALDIFSKDYRAVFGREVVEAEEATVYVGTIGLNSIAEKRLGADAVSLLRPHAEGFLIEVKGDKLYILGSDKRGTAYGLLELSRLIGVSPWEWWADSPIEKRETLTLNEGFRRMEYPSVAHRGIFLNDEDFALMPWSSRTYEPSDVKGTIGPKTHARIFELLLRLRANTFWPAMHACSVAFYLTPGNKETADKYGIYIGTSHCEPMMRNTNAEWGKAGTGAYDYVHNRENVLKFWDERVRQLAGSDNIYTLGIRGVHDGRMQGAKTVAEQKAALTNILKDQRRMLAERVNPDVTKVPQVFIPYKEVLDVYHAGLEVPEDVTLMWCDDNYGYIRRFPTPQERARKGGNGVYYHISYWGRPHDYLWLATNHPAQLYTQMKLAYDKGAKDLWILNVGDIKPAEYLTELFLDMAWNIHAIEDNISGLEKHLRHWLEREFGKKYAGELLAVMNEYYRLAYIRKPEFMGNTRTEEKDPAYKVVKDLPWSEEEIRQRIGEYNRLADQVVTLSRRIPTEKQDAWYQLVEYPVRAAAEMNKKHLYGQLARHGLADWQLSDNAFDTIVSLTGKYNSLAGGKWNRMMNDRPRNLAVFDKLPRTQADTSLPVKQAPLYLFNGNDYKDFEGKRPTGHGLGYQRGAVSLPQGSSVWYEWKASNTDSVTVEVALVPNHPVSGHTLRFSIRQDDGPEQIIDYRTQGRSEEWKLNVLGNQAIRRISFPVKEKGRRRLILKALDEGVVVDQIKIYR